MLRHSSASVVQARAQKAEKEIKKQQERAATAHYFDRYTRCNQQIEAWTTPDYYEKAQKGSSALIEKKIKEAKLEERRRKLEMLLFKESVQYQEELKSLESKPRLYKNGSYLNGVPTSTLEDINEGIREKEEALRRREAELQLYHAWRLRQPEIRDYEAKCRASSLKGAWLEQTVEKEMNRKKQEEELQKTLEARDEAIRQEIAREEERLKEKDAKIKELKSGLESQMARLREAEEFVKKLRESEDRENMRLNELRHIMEERAATFSKVSRERETHIYNLSLCKYRLKAQLLAVQREIDIDLAVLDKIERDILKDMECEREDRERALEVVVRARRELARQREGERQRQRLVDAMFDGEARQARAEQDKTWEKEREARRALMEEVHAALRAQLQQALERNRQMQRDNVRERERILELMQAHGEECARRQQEKQMAASECGAIQSLQRELNALRLERDRASEGRAREAALKSEMERERLVSAELARAHRAGDSCLPAKPRRQR